MPNMADDNKTRSGAGSAKDDKAVPGWLQKAQQTTKDYDQDEKKSLAGDPLNNVIALKEHEKNAKIDDSGNVVLDNVVKSEEDKKLKQEEKQLEGLTFEGDETEKASKTVVGKDKKSGKNVPEWLKALNEKAIPGVPDEKGETKELQEKIIKETEKKPEEKLPISKGKEKKPVVSGEATSQADLANAEKTKEEVKKKTNLMEDVKKGFLTAMKTSKKEIEKGKVAGVDESTVTLENYEESREARAAGNVPEVKSKEKVSAEEQQKLLESEKIYQEGMATVRDLIAPSSMEVNYDHLRVEGMYSRTFVVYSYPRYLDTNWMSPLVNFDATMDISQLIYPIESERIMRILSKKVTQMQSAMSMNAEKGMIRDPALETAYEDAEQLRTEIQRGQEKFFQFAMYITLFADDLKKIDKTSKQLESILGSKLILTKRADLRMEHGFNSTSPLCLDEMEIYRNMNTGPLSTTFPFSSSDLTSSEGILYGLNRHNDSLVIFDRFALPNANSVVFAMSGAGKSYAVKLEILRYLMLGVDIIVIDPENEYEELTKTVGGSYLRVSLTSERRINPFDLPAPLKDEELQPGDLLRSNIIALNGLLKIMLNGLTPAEEGIIDKALNDVYALKGITMDMIDPSDQPVPTMEDLHALLLNMEGAGDLVQRLEKFTKGTYAGIFNKLTNIDMKSGLMVFSIRDLEDSLRPIAMYIVLNFIWNRIRSSLKKRLLIVDEAWTMMQHEDSARFLFGLVKRARKYYLGITTITQDVEDFIKSSYGKPIVTNSAMQLLMKQAQASINILQKVFNLTEGEKYMLLNSGVGQGLFFAGLKHVAIQVIASYIEDKIVTTNPEEILRSLNIGTEEKYE